MTQHLEIRRTPDGRIQARRIDRLPLMPEDWKQAKRMVASGPVPTIDLSDGRIVAVLIDGTVLGAPLWFAFDPAFNPGDGIPVFYCDELGLLKDKPASTLRKIYETKKAFGPGTRVRQ